MLFATLQSHTTVEDEALQLSTTVVEKMHWPDCLTYAYY